MACAIHGPMTCPETPCPGTIIEHPSPDNEDSADGANEPGELSSLGTADDLAESNRDWERIAAAENARTEPERFTLAELDARVQSAHQQLRADPAHAGHVDSLDMFADAIRAKLGTVAVDE